MAFYQFQKEQFIKSTIDTVWAFISTPQNLKKITPDYMGFDIQSQDLPNKIYEGMIIAYKVKPLLGIKTTWVTEITHIKDKSYFVDEQRVGPYALWHHQHLIIPQADGVLMRDIVSYKPPFGLIGSLANSLIINTKLNEIFEYRKAVIEKLLQE
ncbi:MAG: SRPBCC family protein [Bacteroidales bacterium]|nr:SRPBCC family protein [Bacteroidales bacterium]